MPSICKVLSFYSSARIKGKPMDISKYVTVTINDGRFIPFINRRGPVRTPIAISKGVYETLLSRGYKVILMASYNKEGKLIEKNKKISGKNTVFSAVNKGKSIPPSNPTPEKEEAKNEVPPPETKKDEEVKEEPKPVTEEKKVETPAEEVKEELKPDTEEKTEEAKTEAPTEEVKEEKTAEDKSANRHLRVFSNKNRNNK